MFLKVKKIKFFLQCKVSEQFAEICSIFSTWFIVIYSIHIPQITFSTDICSIFDRANNIKLFLKNDGVSLEQSPSIYPRLMSKFLTLT